MKGRFFQILSFDSENVYCQATVWLGQYTILNQMRVVGKTSPSCLHRIFFLSESSGFPQCLFLKTCCFVKPGKLANCTVMSSRVKQNLISLKFLPSLIPYLLKFPLFVCLFVKLFSLLIKISFVCLLSFFHAFLLPPVKRTIYL